MKLNELDPAKYQANLAYAVCTSAASFLADIDDSVDVALYLEQRFGPVLRHPSVRPLLEQIARDGRRLVRAEAPTLPEVPELPAAEDAGENKP